MLRRKLIARFGYLLCAIGVLIINPLVCSQPMHSVMLTVPEYSEEALTWCGPATGQMIMDGYPSGNCYILQDDIWVAIQNHKVETVWDTDPVGLKEAMKDLCPPAGTWVVYAKEDPQKLMHSVAYWMTENNYPAAVLLNTLSHNSYTQHAEHWVAIRGVITDKDPTQNSTVNLEFVWFNDPAPPNLGDPVVVRFISGSDWYSEFQSVTKTGSAYSGKYVAVIEPPEFRGIAVAHLQVVKGRIIPPREALEYATRWIKEYKIYEIEPYRILKKAKPLKPLLVNKDYAGYYIIPFALEERSRLAHAALLVNAYDGSFKEIGKFKPVEYMPKEKAIRTAVEYIKVKKPEQVEAELIFDTKRPVGTRYFPLWKVTVEKKTFLVNQQGKLFSGIPPTECIDFEDPPLGKVYKVGDMFTDSGANIGVWPFQWGNSVWTVGGFAKVGNAGLAGGTGQEMEVNNVNLGFDFSGPITGLTLRFGEYGGNLNIGINGDFQNFQNFDDINGATIGGVSVSVMNGLGNDKGILKLSGKISKSKFKLEEKEVSAFIIIGGQELWIDDVCFR